MLKCQSCSKDATCHVTELVGGKPVEYHFCETHLQNLDAQLQSLPNVPRPPSGVMFEDAGIREALRDGAAREKIAAYFLPVLCVALLDEKPEVRIMAAYWLLRFGSYAASAIGALRSALHDSDEGVRKAVKIALEHLEGSPETAWF